MRNILIVMSLLMILSACTLRLETTPPETPAPVENIDEPIAPAEPTPPTQSVYIYTNNDHGVRFEVPRGWSITTESSGTTVEGYTLLPQLYLALTHPGMQDARNKIEMMVLTEEDAKLEMGMIYKEQLITLPGDDVYGIRYVRVLANDSCM
jgi:hypothetical protein